MAMLRDAAQAVLERRLSNSDVFIWPEEVWTIEYIHEETTELARVLQKIKAPDHLRNTNDVSLSIDDRLHLEWGQLVMMVLTLALQLDIDTDRALNMALAKIDIVSKRKREAMQCRNYHGE